MERIYRILLVAVCAVGILFGLQYFLPITAQYLNIPGMQAIPGLPAMPTLVRQPTMALLPLTTPQPVILNPTGQVFSTFSSATALPGITGSATVTSTSTSTLGATATATTRVISLPTYTPIPIPSATANPGGPCNNILYPVRMGQGWLYRVDRQGGQAQQINMVVAGAGGLQAIVGVTNLTSKAFSQATVDCDNGVIRSFPAIFGGLLLSNMALGGVNVQYLSGILAPSQAAFERANWNLAWSGTYSVSGSANNVPYQGANISIVLDHAPMTFTCQTAGAGNAAFENISAAAGNFRALKVYCHISSQVVISINGQTGNGTLSGSSTQWFGLNTGLLRMVINSSDFNLSGLPVPSYVNTQVELLHFQPAP
jgi:hypothetical protein